MGGVLTRRWIPTGLVDLFEKKKTCGEEEERRGVKGDPSLKMVKIGEEKRMGMREEKGVLRSPK